MNYQIELENFAGPLDLLLFFIRRDEIDIMDIPISHITEEYLSFIEAVQKLNISFAGDFILMAATLMRIKAKMLLPSIIEEDDEAFEDPRTALVQRLLEYQRYKEVANNLSEMGNLQSKKFQYSFSSKDKDLEVEYPEFYLEDVTIFEIVNIFNKLLESIPPPLQYDVEKEEIKIKEKLALILSYFVGKNQILFSELFPKFSSRQDLVVTFIAVLELIRDGHIRVQQKNLFDDILLEKIKV
ncbi:MAG: segregation and condensation protein A [Candidatus Neomarinimicrobiota bacterium]